MSVPFRQRVQIAAKALTGLFTEQSAGAAYNLLTGIYPAATGAVPQRGTRELLQAYSTMPWLAAVERKVSIAVGATEWKLLAPTSKKKDKITRTLQRQMLPLDRHKTVKQALDVGDMKEIEEHPFLDALCGGNPFMVGHALLRLTQIHIDLTGEAFWIKDRHPIVDTPIVFWSVPPDWIKETPTPKRPTYRVNFRAWQGEIPETEIIWFVDPDPSNPYGRGSGLARTLADELETDEYAARHTRMTFLNRARPDMIIFPEESKNESGSISPENRDRLAEEWRAQHQGFWKAALPFFATRKMGVHEFGFNNQELQLTELRKHERDIIIQTYGMPPEELGIIENSNRATIEASDYLFKKNLIVPRVEFLRAYLQEKVLPEYDERLVLHYENPVSEDKEHVLAVATAQPHVLTVDEWREMVGKPPLEDEKGKRHVIESSVRVVEDLDEEPPAPEPAVGAFGTGNPVGVAPGKPAAGGRQPKPGQAPPKKKPPKPPTPPAKTLDGLAADMRVFKEAGDTEGIEVVARQMSDDPEDLPEVSRRVGRKERAVRRTIEASLETLKESVDLEELTAAVVGRNPDHAMKVIDFDAWAENLKEPLEEILRDAFWVGADVAAEEAGLTIQRGPEDVLTFNRFNPLALFWAQSHAATLLVEVDATTKAAVRQAIADGIEQGWSPRKTARVVRESIGLTSRQAASVIRFANRLAEADEFITDEKLFARVGRYTEALRRARALLIARTELIAAANEGQQRLWNMAVENGLLHKNTLRKKWIVTPDERLEQQCEDLGEQPPVPINMPFKNGKMTPPAHPACRCAMGLVRVAAPAPARREPDDVETAVARGMQPLHDLLTKWINADGEEHA